MKNKDHLVGQLTTICGSTCDPRQTVRTSFDNLRRASFVISLAILVLLSRPTRDSRCSRWPRWLRRRCVQALGPRRPDTSGPLALGCDQAWWGRWAARKACNRQLANKSKVSRLFISNIFTHSHLLCQSSDCLKT